MKEKEIVLIVTMIAVIPFLFFLKHIEKNDIFDQYLTSIASPNIITEKTFDIFDQKFKLVKSFENKNFRRKQSDSCDCMPYFVWLDNNDYIFYILKMNSKTFVYKSLHWLVDKNQQIALAYKYQYPKRKSDKQPYIFSNHQERRLSYDV